MVGGLDAGHTVDAEREIHVDRGVILAHGGETEPTVGRTAPTPVDVEIVVTVITANQVGMTHRAGRLGGIGGGAYNHRTVMAHLIVYLLNRGLNVAGTGYMDAAHIIGKVEIIPHGFLDEGSRTARLSGLERGLGRPGATLHQAGHGIVTGFVRSGIGLLNQTPVHVVGIKVLQLLTHCTHVGVAGVAGNGLNTVERTGETGQCLGKSGVHTTCRAGNGGIRRIGGAELVVGETLTPLGLQERSYILAGQRHGAAGRCLF